MKHYLLLLGGFLGFAGCFATGLVAGNSIEMSLFNAALGCLAGAYLFKWLGGLIFDSWVLQRRRAAAAMAAEAAAAQAQRAGAAKGGLK